MGQYFDDMDSIYNRIGKDIPTSLKIIGERYIGENPPIPFAFRCFNKAGILQVEDGRYDINLNKKLSDTKLYHYGYAFGMVWSDRQRYMETALSCYGPTKIYHNKKILFKSGVVEDVNVNNRKVIPVFLEPGWNVFLICMRKEELLPVINDTHGIGIVLLAGIEVDQLNKFLNEVGENENH